jgi:catechol 2,3-dioxygenase-like lactoylglutathione lyase family enzyme
MKTPFSVTTKGTSDRLKEPHSKAFETWAVSFGEAQPAITELEVRPLIDLEVVFIIRFSRGRIFTTQEESGMVCHIHHVHIFASDIDKSIKFYKEFFGGKVILDSVLAGERNVFIRIGNGRVHLYDQPPKNPVRGNIHHFGIQTDQIEEVVENLKAKGIVLKKDITDLGFWKYTMVPAPDDILIELFQVDKTKIPSSYADYFE